MSTGAALQKALLVALKADLRVEGWIKDRVFDSTPPGAVFPYISFGPSDVAEDGADGIESGEHTMQLDVWSRTDGRVEARKIVDAVKAALHGRDLTLEDGALVDLRVDFRQVVGDPDGLTSHGIVRVTALIEEDE